MPFVVLFLDPKLSFRDFEPQKNQFTVIQAMPTFEYCIHEKNVGIMTGGGIYLLEASTEKEFLWKIYVRHFPRFSQPFASDWLFRGSKGSLGKYTDNVDNVLALREIFEKRDGFYEYCSQPASYLSRGVVGLKEMSHWNFTDDELVVLKTFFFDMLKDFFVQLPLYVMNWRAKKSVVYYHNFIIYFTDNL